MDCMEGMKDFPDKFFELAVVDPPYGIGEDGGKKREGPKSIKKGLKSKNYEKKYWDKQPPLEYWNELFRVSKNQIVWGGNYFINFLRSTSCFLIWDKKGNDRSNFADCEIAWSSFNSAIRCFYYPWIGFGSINSGEIRIHPTQKPIALYSWLLKNYAKPGDKILDTHMGSQSSRIAAYKMGFDYWGYEIDKDYFREGCERFEKAISEPLFDSVKPGQGKLL